MLARLHVFLCALVVCATGPFAAAIEPTYFTLDPTQSVLSASATIQIPSIGLIIPTTGQGNNGLGIPQFSSGASGQIEGVLAAEINWDAGSMVLGGGSLHGRDSGIWEPMPGGAAGIAPAFLGILIQQGAPPTGTRIMTAFRDFFVDYRNAFSTTSLTPAPTPGYTFPANEWFDISSNVDLQGQAGLGGLLDPDRVVLEEPYAAQNNAGVGGLTPTPVVDQWRISVPVNTTASIDAFEVEGLGSVFISLQIQGQLVGFSSPLGPQSVLDSAGTNTSLATAQALDGTFAVAFDPNVGNETLNTSAGIPHISVQGTLSGAQEFFSFTVTEAGATGIFDIDGADFDSMLFLYDAAGNLLATNDDAPYNAGGLGSLTSLDSFLQYVFDQPGLYKLGVGAYIPPGGPLGAPLEGDYLLNVSLSGAVLVPEPSTLALASCAPLALVLGWLRRNRKALAVACSAIAMALLVAQPGLAASPLIKQSIEDVYDRDGQYPMPYRLFTPPEVAQPGETYPLVLFLHGSGERGEDNFYQVANHVDGLIEATQSEQFRSFLLAPQLTRFPGGPGGWNDNSPFDRTMEILEEVVQNYPVDPSRIYITGLSMGGFGTFHYLSEYPTLFAAAVPMSGGGSTSTAPIIKDVPLWNFHGALDATVSVNQSRNMINALIAAGGDPRYTELPGGGHDIWWDIYKDASLHEYGLYEWMFSQQNPNALPINVPEPSGVVLAAIALGALLAARRRRRSNRF